MPQQLGIAEYKPLGIVSYEATKPEPAKPTTTPDASGVSDWANAFGRAALGNFSTKVDPALLQNVGDGVIGILKGMGHTAVSLGELVHKLPGVSRAVDAVAGPGMSQSTFAAAHEAVQPSNTAQRVGYGAEQMGEFLIPAAVAERGAVSIANAIPKFTNAPRIIQAAAKAAPRMATEAASAAGVSVVQGASPVAPAIVAAGTHGLSALAGEAVPALRAAADKQVQQFQGATKERFKAMAERLTPGILQRGLRGSRESVLAQATDAAEVAGQQIDEAIQAFGGRQVGVQPVVDALERAKDAFRTTVQAPVAAPTAAAATWKDFTKDRMGAYMASEGGHGPAMTRLSKEWRTMKAGLDTGAEKTVGTATADKIVVFEPRAVKQLDGLQQIIANLGPDATVAQLIGVRRAWDKVVDQAGGFSHRGAGAIGMPLKDTTEAAAKLEATTAIRKLLDREVPEISALNKEFSFWKGLQDVLTQTTQRTQPQKQGLGGMIAEGAGQAVGGVAGSGGGPATAVGSAFALGKVAKMAQSVFQSPRWQLASAQTKDALATAIARNNVSEIAAVLGRVGAGATAQVGR